MRYRFVIAILLITLLIIVLGGVAMAQNLLWEDQFNLAGGRDQANVVAPIGNRVVGIGTGYTQAGGLDMLIRSYDVATGTLQWSDSAPINSFVLTKVLGSQDNQIAYVCGYTTLGGGGTNILARAYDPVTGTKLWESLVDKGADDFPQDITAEGNKVFVVAYGGNVGPSPLDAIILAYDAATGQIEWEHQIDAGGDDVAWLVKAWGNRVYVASTFSLNTADPWTMKVTAYDADTGVLIWETLRPGWTPITMAVVGDHVYVGGTDNSSSGGGFLLALDGFGNTAWNVMKRTWDLKPIGSHVLAQHDGAVDVYNSAGNVTQHILILPDQGIKAAVFGDVIYFLGSILGPPDENHEQPIVNIFVRAIDSTTGTVLDETVMPGRPISISDLKANASGLYAAGRITNVDGNNDFLIQAFSPVSIEPQPPARNPEPPPPPAPPSPSPNPPAPPVVPPETPATPPPVVPPPVTPPPARPQPVKPKKAIRETVRNAKRKAVKKVNRPKPRSSFSVLRSKYLKGA